MLHIGDSAPPSGFLLVAGNFHDIRPHQTAHPPVCAKKKKVKDFSDDDQLGSPSSRHPSTLSTFASPKLSIPEAISSSFQELALVVVLIDLGRLRLRFRACPSFPHEPPWPPDPLYPWHIPEPRAPSDPPYPTLAPSSLVDCSSPQGQPCRSR